VGIINDPYRNGILLSDLFCTLVGIDMYGIIMHPNTISECRENLIKVFNIAK